MVIRKYQESDRLALIDLWKAVFPEDPPHNEPSQVIDSKLAVDDLIFVAESDGKIVGACMVGYDGHRGWLYAVAVLPEYRRAGIGARLVEHAIRCLKELGCVKVNLQIRSSNAEVVAFYDSLGFKVEDRVSMGMLVDDSPSRKFYEIYGEKDEKV
ncbi:GNAT family acetyltransferase [bacterium]|nr:GNAT family acetyltransferase [bacterium]